MHSAHLWSFEFEGSRKRFAIPFAQSQSIKLASEARLDLSAFDGRAAIHYIMSARSNKSRCLWENVNYPSISRVEF